MALTRAAVVTELAARLAVPLTDAGIATTDDPGNLKEPLDDTFRLAGYDEGDLTSPTIADTDTLAILTLAVYVTLGAIRDRLLDRFDLSTDGDSFKLSQSLANVERRITAAEADVIARWGSMPSGAESGVIMLDLGQLTAGGVVVGHDFPYTIVGMGDG